MENYDITARGYLARARKLMAQDQPEAYFYAAFELRAGLEARLSEYLSEWEHVPKKAKQEWKIGSLNAHVLKAFSGTEDVTEVAFLTPVGTARFLYTPVRQSGRDVVQFLGNYLHAQKRVLEKVWWEELREKLETAERELTFAVTGTLLGPAMLKAKSQGLLRSEILSGKQPTFVPQAGDKLVVRVNRFPAHDYVPPRDAYAWRG